MKIKQIDVYQTNWSWGRNMDNHLKDFANNLYTLNFPCGKSTLGDVRADILPSLKPDIVCDLRHSPFRPGVFECVVCDPPFSLFNRFFWLIKLKDCCSKYFLLSTPKLAPNFRGFKRKILWTSVKDKLFLRPWILYTAKRNIPAFFHNKVQKKLEV